MNTPTHISNFTSVFISWTKGSIFLGILAFLLLSQNAQGSDLGTEKISIAIDASPFDITTINSCKGGDAVMFTQTSMVISGTWSVNGGGGIEPTTGVFTPTATGCYTATFTASDGCVETESFVVFPVAPNLSAPESICITDLVLPTVATQTGFDIEYSINGATYTTNPTVPTVAGCYSISARYALAATCGSTTIGTSGDCATSDAVSTLAFPAVSGITGPANTCNEAFALPSVPAATGFSTQYSIDGATYVANPTIPTTPGCHTVTARYVFDGSCGSKITGRDATGTTCATSSTFNVVIYPTAPTLTQPEVITCSGDFPLPEVPAVDGFTIHYDYCDDAYDATPTESGVYEVLARYELDGDCGSTKDGSLGQEACRNSNIVLITYLPSKPVADCPEGEELDCNPDPEDYEPDGPFWNEDRECRDTDLSTGFIEGMPINTGGCNYSITHKYWATDRCMNTDTCYQTFTWIEDNESPTITPIGGVASRESTVNLECGADISVEALGAPVAADDCGISSFTYEDRRRDGNCIEEYVITRTWRALDNCENRSQHVQTINVVAPLRAAFCPSDTTLVACSTETDIATAYAEWVSGFTFTGCIPTSNIADIPTLPTYVCGEGFSLSFTLNVGHICDETIVSCTSNFTVVAATPLSVSCPAPVDLSACTTESDILAAYNTWISGFSNSDGCNAQTPSSAPALPDFVCGGAVNLTYNYSVTDDCGTKTCSSTFAVAAATSLSVSCPAPVSLSACTTESNILSAYNTWVSGFSKSDGCNAQTPSSAPALPDFVCGGAVNLTYNYSVTDDCGTKMCSSTFAVAAATPLSIDCPTDVSLSACATESEIAIAYGAWVAGFTVSDGCNSNSNISDLPELPTFVCGSAISLPFTFSVTDDCNTTALTCSSTFAVAASVPLSIDCPKDVGLTACATESEILAAYTTWAAGFTVSDGCNATSNLASIPVLPPFDCGSAISLSFTFSVTDDCNTTALTCSSAFTVTGLPAIMIVSCPSIKTVEGCDSDDILNGNQTALAYSETAVTVTGAQFTAEGGEVGRTCDHTITYIDTKDSNCAVEVTRTWTVTDICMNSTSCTQTIHITDTTDPEITCPADLTISCEDSYEPTFTGMAAGNDNCDSSPVVTYSDVVSAIDEGFGYVITRTWTVTDVCNNAKSCDQVITVTDCEFNLTDPCACLNNSSSIDLDTGLGGDDGQFSEIVAITGPDKASIPFNPAVTFEVLTSTGGVDAFATAPIAPAQTAGNPIAVGTALVYNNTSGHYELPFYHNDGVGFSITIRQLINGVPVAVLGPISNNCVYPNPVISPSIADLYCPDDVAITLAGEDPTGLGSDAVSFMIDKLPVTQLDPGALTIGTHTIEMTWDGAAGTSDGTGTAANPNQPGCIQTVFKSFEVNDTEAPVITCPADTTINCTEITSPDNTGMATAMDNCNTEPVLTFSDVRELGDCSHKYTIVRTWTATDGVGLQDICVQTIMVQDTTPPTNTGPADFTVQIDYCEEVALVEFDDPVATDDCDTAPTVLNESGITSGDMLPAGVYPILYSTTDICGNRSTFTITITVLDPPSLLCSANSTTTLDPASCAVTLTPADLIQGNAVGGLGNLLIKYELVEAYHVHDAADVSGEELGEITLTVPGRYRYNIGCADENFPDQCWNYFIVEDKRAPVCAVAGDAEPNTTICGVDNLPDPSGVDDLATEIVSCTVIEKYGEDALEPWFDVLELSDDATSGAVSDFSDCSALNELFVSTTSRNVECDDLTDWGVVIPTGWRVCKVYTRSWQVTDWTGLKSEPCSQNILIVSPIGNSTMIRIDEKIEASCSDTGLPSGGAYFLDLGPAADGRLRTCPSTSAMKVEIPEGSDFCKIGATMTMSEDIEICGDGEDCSSAYKKLIYWNVIDGCTNDKIYDGFTQILEVYDRVGPSIADKKAWITAQPFDCVSKLNASFTATDDCSTVTRYEINVSYDMPSGHLMGGGLVSRTYDGSSLELDDIPNGVDVTVTFIAYDCCGNPSEMSEIVTTIDESDPVCIADDELVVGLIKADYHNSEDELVHAVGARVDAASVSEGSQDNCFAVGYEIRRLSRAGDVITDYAPYIDFVYADATGITDGCIRTEWIDLKVYEDRNGNGQHDADERFSICSSLITLVDRTEPMSSGVECISYDCTDPITDVAAPTITWDPSGCSSIAFVSDTTETYHCPELANCEGEMIYVLSKRTIIHRMIKDTEHTNYSQDITQVVYEKMVEAVEIALPWDLKVDCNSTYDPGTVVIDNPGCSDWAMSGPKVRDYTSGDATASVCGTITYEYQFMNSCKMNRWERENNENINRNSASQLINKSSFDINNDGKVLNDGVDMQVILDESSVELEDGFFSYIQVIKVVDDEAPVATVTDTAYCAISNGCNGGVAEFEVIAIDGCSTASITEWFINEDDDNNFGFFRDQDKFSGTGLAKGSYELHYKIEDQCGNAVWLTATTEVLWDDCKKPTVICLAALAPVMENGSVAIAASTFVTSLDDNCTSTSILTDNLRAFIPTDTNNDEIINGDDIEIGIGNGLGESSVTLTCQQYGFGSVPAAVWTMDEKGNYQYCLTIIDIQAGRSGACDQSDPMVAGDIVNASDEMISDVTVNLWSSAFGSVNDIFDGFFDFSVPMHSSASIEPKKDINYLNGVSTADLVILQRHILGVEDLTSAYQLIAADVSGDSKVDTRDMLHLSRLILGINDDFSNTESWKFVPKDHQFANPTSPWGYPQKIDLEQMSSTERADFIGIKMGDLSGNAKPNNLLGEDMLPSEFLKVEILNKQLDPNKVTSIPFYATAENNISGYQFTVTLEDDVTFVSVEPGALPKMNVTNFGQQKVEEGILTTYWAYDRSIPMNGEEVLFTINVISDRAINISDVLSITSDVTDAEAYDEDLEVLGVQHVFNIEDKGRLALHQNKPNPFSDDTVIGFELPGSDDVLLVIRDVAGRTLKTINGNYPRGYNEIKLSTSDLKGMTGVLYYELITSFGSPSKKMIVVD